MKVSEENFIKELKKKNEKALEFLIDNYGWVIKTVCKKHLSEFPSLLDDCMNEVLMDIWNNSHRFDDTKGNIKNWIAGISRFKSIDFKRKYFRDLQLTDIDDVAVSVEESLDLSSQKIELSDETEEFLTCLKKTDRELFIKLYVEDKEMDEVTQETGLNRNVIYNRLSRGKRKIKNLFAHARV
ncbi:MAG: sigma-70 family RNA polymerase sigma factor [Sarcina sp.]